jgi:RNA polymerase sigma-70 factor (ECF subfamily)
MAMNKSDEVLVRKYLRRRDERSFRELYRRHAPSIYALALRLSASEADAHDATQETWLRGCSALPAFEWRSTLRTWLSGILINCVREQSRKREREQQAHLAEDWIETVADSSGALNLEQTIAQLPDGYRHVLTLHDVEGHTHEEISRLLNISVGTSKSQLHHARRAVRTLFLQEKSK